MAERVRWPHWLPGSLHVLLVGEVLLKPGEIHPRPKPRGVEAQLSESGETLRSDKQLFFFFFVLVPATWLGGWFTGTLRGRFEMELVSAARGAGERVRRCASGCPPP